MSDSADSLGNIPGSAPMKQVLTEVDYHRALKIFDKLPDLTIYSKNEVAMLRTNVGTTGAGRMLRNNHDPVRPSWTPLTIPDEGVDTVSSIRSHRIDLPSINRSDVYIRWIDPEDLKDAQGNVVKCWKKTVIVRKYGSIPTSPDDGNVVVSSTVRNYHNTIPFIDHLPLVPSVLDKDWYYKAFTFSEDGSVNTSIESEFTPFLLDWEYIGKYIQEGWAEKMFAVGDSIALPVFTGATSHPFSGVECVVAGFNQVKLASNTKKYSMTLVAKIPVSALKFDTLWTDTGASGGKPYRFTRDEYAQPSKRYYVRSTTGTFSRIELTPGTKILPQTYYEAVANESYKQLGSNRWSMSEIRRWLNYNVSGFSSPNLTTVAPPLYTINSIATTDKDVAGFRNTLAPVMNTTVQFMGRDMEGEMMIGSETTKDTFFLMSETEVFGTDPADVKEGVFFKLFDDGYSKDWYGKNWWLRTPAYDSEVGSRAGVDMAFSRMEFVNSSGNLMKGNSGSVSSQTACIYVAFALA